MGKKVSIVIPNYNGMAFLPDCLASLSEQTTTDFEVTVIDNASEDESVRYVKEHYPQVRVIVNEENLGFSGAVNIGIKEADAPFVLLLNNDTKADPAFVENLLRSIEQSDRIFSVSGKMVKADGSHTIDDAGDLFNVLGWSAQRGISRPEHDFDKRKRVFSACAGAAIYRRSVFDEIGLFDRNHFAYLEDVDIGYRAQIAGYQNYYEPSAVVMHVGSGTSGSRYNSFKVKLAARNRIYLLYKNMPVLQVVINFLPLLAGTGIKILFFSRMGFGADYREGLAEGFHTKGKCQKVRFRVRKIPTYFYIELQLIGNTFLYAAEYILRRIRK